ncbi:hypothetical protein JCM11491_005746 [Sporobolomyces phaffii]
MPPSQAATLRIVVAIGLLRLKPRDVTSTRPSTRPFYLSVHLPQSRRSAEYLAQLRTEARARNAVAELPAQIPTEPTTDDLRNAAALCKFLPTSTLLDDSIARLENGLASEIERVVCDAELDDSTVRLESVVAAVGNLLPFLLGYARRRVGSVPAGVLPAWRVGTSETKTETGGGLSSFSQLLTTLLRNATTLSAASWSPATSRLGALGFEALRAVPQLFSPVVNALLDDACDFAESAPPLSEGVTLARFRVLHHVLSSHVARSPFSNRDGDDDDSEESVLLAAIASRLTSIVTRPRPDRGQLTGPVEDACLAVLELCWVTLDRRDAGNIETL